MNKIKNNLVFSEMPATWDALVAFYPLRPIHDEVDLENATEVIDAMAGHQLNRDQEDYLDALATLVSAYEDERRPVEVDSLKGLAMLRSLLLDHAMTAADLGRLLGLHRGHAAKILNGERSLTVEHLKKLSDHFKVSPALFISMR